VAGAFNTMAGRLQAQDRQRRELMADIAHELRTPLAVIQGRLEGLLDGVYARDEEHLAGVLEETRVLARLVEDLRTLANAETGVLTLQKEPTDLSMLIRDVVNSFSSETAGRDIGVQVHLPADLPLLTIDPLRIREVLINLLSNALRFTPPGGSRQRPGHCPRGPAEDLRPLLQGEGVARFRPRADHRAQPGHGARRIDSRRERTRRRHDAELHAPARLTLYSPIDIRYEDARDSYRRSIGGPWPRAIAPRCSRGRSTC